MGRKFSFFAQFRLRMESNENLAINFEANSLLVLRSLSITSFGCFSETLKRKTLDTESIKSEFHSSARLIYHRVERFEAQKRAARENREQ